MQTKCTQQCIRIHSVLPILLVLFFSFSSSSIIAQNMCDNAAPVFIENFGTGSTITSHPDIVSLSASFQSTGDLATNGVYRIVNNTQQNTGWHAVADHTGNADGKMLVISGNGNTFYRHIINNSVGFQPGYYSVSMFFMNPNLTNNCLSGNAPTISFLLEYQAADNSWIALGGSTVSAPLIAVPTWIQLKSMFILTTSQAEAVQNMRISINDGALPACGNDFAIDDIGLSLCSSSGPLPVAFITVTAKQKGTGISVNWSTASEINNKYFDLERSTDGGANWQFVSTVNAIINNASVKNYTAFDSKPSDGLNYYRVKQIDYDGNFKYSFIVHQTVAGGKTIAVVVANPFVTNCEINFLVKEAQQVTANLFDVTGKLVATDRWTLPQGAMSKTTFNTKSIQKGIYILSIKDKDGNSVYNGKLMKQ